MLEPDRASRLEDAQPKRVTPSSVATAVTGRSWSSRGTRVEDLLGVEQHADEGARGHPRERPVVGPAAAAEAHPVAADGQAGDQHDVGGRDGVEPEGRAVRLEQPAAGGAQAARVRRTPPSRGRCRAAAAAGSPACRRACSASSSGTGAGLAGDRDVGRDGGRPADLRSRQQVVRQRPARARRGRLSGRCRRAARSWSRRASLATPMNSCTAPAYDRSMNSKGLRQAREKMQAAGVDPVAIDVFAHYYRQIEHGETGMIAERHDRAARHGVAGRRRGQRRDRRRRHRRHGRDQAQRRPRHLDGDGPRQVAAVRTPRTLLPRRDRPPGAAPAPGVRRHAAADLHEQLPHLRRHPGRAGPLRRPRRRGAAAGVPAEQGAQAARRRPDARSAGRATRRWSGVRPGTATSTPR